MSADTEAQVASPAPAEQTTAEEVSASGSAKAGEQEDKAGEDGEAKEQRHENGSGRDLDKKYSKTRDDDGNHRHKRSGNFKSRDFYNKRSKFDRTNVKSRYDDQEKTNDPAQIRKQVEFYFSDANLLQDKFLFNQIGGSDNNAIDLKVITSFKRMQRFEPYSAIVAALKESTTLDIINQDKPNDEQIKRKTPLPETSGKTHEEVKANYNSASMKRSIYAKGFGDETSRTQLELEEFFAPYGAASVRLRRSNDGLFKGSVFVEFENEEETKQFLDLDEKPEWNGKKLEIKSKEAYCKEKDKLINDGKIRRNDLDDNYPGKGPRRDQRGGKGRFNGRDRGSHRYNNRRDRDRSQSGSRSPERRSRSHRDLETKNWREIADNERKEKEAKKQEQEYDDDGIPKVKSSPAQNTATNGKKRAYEDADGEDEGEVKKVKSNDD